MSSIGFTRGETPYKNRDALLDDYTPDELVGRDDELKEYQSLLNPVIWGDQPNNIFLYGKAGVGKTAATRFMLGQLEHDAKQYDDIDLSTLHINCDGLESSYQVGVEIVNSLRDSRNQISESGYSKAEIYNKMWRALEQTANTILIVLDEVDHVRKDDSILYQLSRAHENGKLDETKIGVIGISNDMTFRSHLSSKVRSSLCERELSFSDYNAEELKKVLQQREAVAFKDDAVADGVISLCAALAAQETGDAREGLDYLLVAGDLARDEQSEIVQESHVHQGKKKVERQTIVKGLADRGEQARYVAYALATLLAEEQQSARFTDLYTRYKSLTSRTGSRTLSERWVREHLQSLGMLGIVSIEEKNEGVSGGHYNLYGLNPKLELVVEALDETLDMVGVHDSISDYVDH